MKNDQASTTYHPQVTEPKWQASWEEQALFQQSEAKQDSHKPKKYLLFAFAYPSGAGLHVGHVESKTALDILARHYRMTGHDVFFPVGWDAFGLPAENYAIKTGVPPAVTTKNAIDEFRRQIKRVGISYDWANEIATNHPGYYKWTQWLFLQLYKKGLAYQGTGKVNWCPSCQTVLANEQVVNGHCERCGSEVIQKEMKQWYFKITDYKDELISGLDEVDWPSATKLQQVNWIGKSEGATVQFPIKDSKQALSCFTTRVDTIFGVTFVVISPEKFEEMKLMELVEKEHQQTVQNYIDQAYKKTEEERKIGEKEKTGVDTGLKVVNPVNGQEVQVFVADYVLAGYGTGVVMGVPGHDQRDGDFAKKFNLEIIEVIKGAKTEYGTLVNSGKYDGLSSEEAMVEIAKEFPEAISKTTTYKLRDWLISRQRYWGAPIPVVYDPEGNAHPVKEEHLPWTLPTDVEFKPTGESPLTYSKEFIKRTEELYGKGWRPEYDTMDTFVDSSWYFLRYLNSRDTEQFGSKDQFKKWLPIDLYMIGPEHIVLHLLYSRFFTKFLRDEGYLSDEQAKWAINEPFKKMRHQGMIMGPDGKKMSKSKGNVINPDEVIEKYGADTLRVYEMFMGPIEADKPWSTSSVVGVYRFLNRVHDLVSSSINNPATTKNKTPLSRSLQRTIRKVSSDIPELKFNTAIAALMEFLNEWEAAVKSKSDALPMDDVKAFVHILCPFAPFLGEELWSQMQQGKAASIHLSSWPSFDQSAIEEEEVNFVIQVNGKMRGSMRIPRTQAREQAAVEEQAKTDQNVQKWLSGAQIKQVIFVPEKIINFVI